MTFEAAFEAYWPLAVRIARRILRDSTAAEDAAAEGFARAWPAWDGVKDPENYLARVVRNAALDSHRRRRRVTWLSLDALLDRPDATAPPDRWVDWWDAAEALTALSARHRAILGAVGAGYLHREIAARQGTTEDTIKRSVNRARSYTTRVLAGGPRRYERSGPPPRVPVLAEYTRVTTDLSPEDWMARRREQWRRAKQKRKERNDGR